MNKVEQPVVEADGFGETFDIAAALEGIDIDAAFQNAMHGVVSNVELALEEKIRRMEVILDEGNSETYSAFIDFRSMAAQMEMFCMEDHALGAAVMENSALSSFVTKHSSDDGHGHESDKHAGDHDEYETSTGPTKKKKKKKQESDARDKRSLYNWSMKSRKISWFGIEL